MAKPKHTTNRTFVCHGRLHRNTAALDVLKPRRINASVLYDAALDELATYHDGVTLNGNQRQKLATAVAQQLGINRGPLNTRCRIAIVGNAVNAWNNHINHGAGMPRKYERTPVTTIETFADSDRHHKPLVITNASGDATLHFPGLPPIRLSSCRPLPDDQPTYCSVSVREKQVSVSLTYLIPQEPLPADGQWDPYAVLGIDVGIIDLISTSAQISHAGITQEKLQKQIKRAIKIKAAMVRKAMRQGRCGYRPLLNENGVPIRSLRGRPRRYLKWENDQPTKEYVKAQKCLSRLLKQCLRQRRSYRHQVAAQIVKHCRAHGIQLIATEDLKIVNLTKSASGTLEHPGTNVAQKRGLNRRILEQGWAEVLGYIQYKARDHGIRFVKINAWGTSQTCSLCGHRDKKSRQGKRFHCVSCGHQDDADTNAAVNIGDRGTYYFTKRLGSTLESIRQRRLQTARQEPGTGLGPLPLAGPTGSTGFHPPLHVA